MGDRAGGEPAARASTAPEQAGSSDGGAPGPVAALERIAFLLEQAGAPTYRVRAFRTAARTVTSVPDADLADLAAGGRLTELAGVGATTGTVVADALAGRVPDYLARLEEEAGRGPAPDPAVAELVATLRGDCHSHTDQSDGGSPLEAMVAAAIDLDREYLAVTDHSPRLTVAHGLPPERRRRQMARIAELNESVAPFRILSGIEVDILDDGSLDADDGLLADLDVVVASVHSKLRMDRREMTARMLAAVRHPHVDILGHCTGRIVVGRGRPQSEFDADAVFAACAESGTAVEINSRPERLDPPDELLGRAAAAGCHFAVDTDAHAPGQLSWLANGAAKAVACGIGADRIVTAWPVGRLRAWTGGG